jgi:tetratricopeptide (TPR) repeat protein
MSTQQVITLVMSAIALGISVYGIVERRTAAFTALRVRFSELVTMIAKFQVEEEETPLSTTDSSPSERWARLGASFSGRRALVTYQALALQEQLRDAQKGPFTRQYRLTTDEYATIAVSLGQLRDWQAADEEWTLAVDAANGATAVSRAAAHNGRANCLFELGRHDEARREYGAAADAYPEPWDKFLVFHSWLAWELTVGGQPDAPRRSAEQLAAEPSRWQASARAMLANPLGMWQPDGQEASAAARAPISG